MKRQNYFVFFLTFLLSAVAIAYPAKKASTHGDES